MEFLIVLFLILNFLITSVPCFSYENDLKNTENNEIQTHLFKGYVTNKFFIPLKLKIGQLESDSLLENGINFDNDSFNGNSFTPQLNLKLTAENAADYKIPLEQNDIFVPEGTKFFGYISEIVPPKKFDKKGYFKVTFDKAICPDGQTIYLKKSISK